MTHRLVFKKRQVDLLLEEVILPQEDEMWDPDIQELRFRKWQEVIARQEAMARQQRARRFNFYFLSDGSCKAHDKLGCGECRHYANGGCPSYWEEKY